MDEGACAERRRPYYDVKKLLHGLSLHTVCEEARCPNISECWGRGTATFQILGDTCTRACRYCYVHSGKPEHDPDPLEPLRVGQAAAQMELKHVVVTSVDRDDVPDRGAGHFAATIRAIKAKLPQASVEVLTPDFLGVEEGRPARCSQPGPMSPTRHRTVRRLHRSMRGAKASYDTALWLLGRAKELADYPVLTKSGIIVGLGETNDAVVETMPDLRAHGVDVVTIGQYLQPSPKHAAIDRWVHPDEFPGCGSRGRRSASAPSSPGRSCVELRANEQRHAAATGRGAVAYSQRRATPFRGGAPVPFWLDLVRRSDASCCRSRSGARPRAARIGSAAQACVAELAGVAPLVVKAATSALGSALVLTASRTEPAADASPSSHAVTAPSPPASRSASGAARRSPCAPSARSAAERFCSSSPVARTGGGGSPATSPDSRPSDLDQPPGCRTPFTFSEYRA